MPVLMDIVSRDHHLFRGEENDVAKTLSESPNAMARCVNIGLLNNMPDLALISTERQLFELLNVAAGTLPVHLQFYTLPTIARTEWGGST